MENLPPSFNSIKYSLYKVRHKIIPRQPALARDLELTSEWTTTIDGRDFIVADERGRERIVVFGTRVFLKKMCNEANGAVFMDGTFKATPSIFAKIYTIHCFVKSQMLTVAYCLVSDRLESTYRRLLSLIKRVAYAAGIRFAPTCAQVDFEQGVIRALAHELPDTHVRGCYFHFAQCLWRKIQELGLAVQYRTNGSVKKFLCRNSLRCRYYLSMRSLLFGRTFAQSSKKH